MTLFGRAPKTYTFIYEHMYYDLWINIIYIQLIIILNIYLYSSYGFFKENRILIEIKEAFATINRNFLEHLIRTLNILHGYSLVIRNRWIRRLLSACIKLHWKELTKCIKIVYGWLILAKNYIILTTTWDHYMLIVKT